MKAVARLVLAYFTATAWLTRFSAVSAAMVAYYLLRLDAIAPGAIVPAIFVGTFSVCSWMMPQMFDRMARSQMIDLLPFGRLKLVASVFLTTALVSFAFAIVSLPATNPSSPVDYAQFLVYFGKATTVLDYVQVPFFWNFLAMVMLWCMWTYALFWTLADYSTLGPTRRMLLLVPLVLLAPVIPKLGLLKAPRTSTVELVAIIVSIWVFFAVGFVMWPKLRSAAIGPQRPAAALLKFLDSKTRYSEGNEMRLVLGLGSRWLHCLSIILCIVLVVSSMSGRGLWFFWFTIVAFTVGGMPAYAAAKGRLLWLREPWSRAELFTHIEVFYWRHAGPSLAVLMLSFLAIGIHLGLSWFVIALGLVHGASAAAASIYLGLRQTVERRVSDAVLAVCTLFIGILPGGGSDIVAVVGMTALVAMLALRYRFTAKRRWIQLDWMVCKPVRAT